MGYMYYKLGACKVRFFSCKLYAVFWKIIMWTEREQICQQLLYQVDYHQASLTWLEFLIDKAVITLLQLYSHSALAQSIFSTILGIKFVLKKKKKK